MTFDSFNSVQQASNLQFLNMIKKNLFSYTH